MFDYFLFNLVTISAGELHIVHAMIIVFDYFLLSPCISGCELLYIKCMIIVCLTIFSSILSPFQSVSNIKCMIIVFDYFLFDLVTISGGKLHKVHDYCVFDYNFSLQSCHHLRW